MNKAEMILNKMSKLREQLEQLEQDFRDARREISDAVVFSRKSADSQTITLTHGKDQYKVTKNGRGRWCVKLNGRVVVGDYTSGIPDLRYAIATGQLFQMGSCRI